MIVHYARGTDQEWTENTSDLHWGKYDSPMAKYLSTVVQMDGDFGDDEESDNEGTGMSRYGRRILYWNDQGFVGCTTERTVADAERLFDQYREDFYSTCETCGETVHNDSDSYYEHERYDCGLSGEDAIHWLDQYYGRESDAYSTGNGVAWRIRKVFPTLAEVLAVMVGDDRETRLGLSDLVPLEEEEFCSECGQIGCGWH